MSSRYLLNVNLYNKLLFDISQLNFKTFKKKVKKKLLKKEFLIE